MSEEVDPVSQILARDTRYPRAAYDLVREAMRHTLQELGERRHVSAAELLEGLREFAVEEYGPLARTVLASCAIGSTTDIGEIVFNLIDAGEFGKNDDDARDDFADVYDFDDAFPVEPGDVVLHDPREEDDIWKD